MTNDSTSPGSSVDWAYLLANLGTIVVRQAKHYSCRLPLFGRPHSHEDRFHFSYVRSGKCRIRIDETALSVGADDLVFIRPGQVHESLGDKQVDYELIELRVSVDADADRTLIPAFKPVTHIDNAAVFFPILERVVTAYQLDPFPENWLVRVRLVEMMMVLAREEGPLTSTLTD
ncbi:MAG: AraC family ligand binding domain-containing protein, partial [Candidatus Pacebacteria bacterium]|nr:AraC family ligand binding domain-containing protein [Candidatus Paceibacterota bacterium]